MRVLMVNLGYAPDVIGGAETVVRTLAHALAGRGAYVSIAALSNVRCDWHYDDAGVRVHFLAAHPMGNLLTNPERTLSQRVVWQLMGEWRGWSRRRIAKLVATERPDIIHTHNLVGLSTSAWAVARAHSLPSVHTVHGYQLLCPAGTMLRGGRPCGRQCESCRIITTARRRASALPRAVVGNSAFTLGAHLAAGYFVRATHHVIPNAPPPAVLSRTAGTAAPLCPSEPRASIAPVLRIGYLGRLAPYKGAGLLLDALARLPKGGWIARIAGTGLAHYVRTLEEAVRRSDLPVFFLGWANPDAFFREIDLLVVPSMIAEPQGMGVAEAVSRHVPVVYADLGGLGEIGALTPGAVPFASGSADDLARVLLRLVSSPAELAILRQNTFAPNPLCDASLFADRYFAVYQQTLSPMLPQRAPVPGARPGAKISVPYGETM